MVGNAADWMKSSLVGHYQSLDINTSRTFSKTLQLNYDIPQSLTLKQFGFKFYTKSITAIARTHDVSTQFYADNTPLYHALMLKKAKSP